MDACAVRSDRRLSVSLSSNDLEAIRQLLKLVTDNDLSELTASLREGVSVTIKADELALAPPIVANYTIPLDSERRRASVTPSIPLPQAPRAVRGTAVVSPMMGIFYASPAPGDPPFVQIGDEIAVGQTIGLIEAMKVFSEVPSEAAGRVLEVAAANGDIVQQGQALLYLESDQT
jgi:acetyl-CoA carboxylase biotin carboxyl carrier protein